MQNASADVQSHASSHRHGGATWNLAWLSLQRSSLGWMCARRGRGFIVHGACVCLPVNATNVQESNCEYNDVIVLEQTSNTKPVVNNKSRARLRDGIVSEDI